MGRRALQVFSVVAMVGLFATMAFAQEEAEIVKKSWFDLFKSTGLVGIMLVITSMIGTALLIQYMVNLNEVKIGNPTLLSEVDALLSENDLDGAFTLAQSDQSYAGKVIAGAIGRSVGGFEEAKHGMDESAAVEGFKLNAKLSYLSLVGNIGPLLGLLGTVTGMISSFQVIENLKAPTPGDLAKGVYESLVNTTMGLFIGIVFLTAFFVFKNKVTKMTLSMNLQAVDLLKHLAAVEEKGP
jgi:biopolymer transport protein ExbB